MVSRGTWDVGAREWCRVTPRSPAWVTGRKVRTLGNKGAVRGAGVSKARPGGSED